MKRMIQSLVTICFMILMCKVQVFAEDIYTEGYFKYTVEDDSVAIVEYYGNEETVTVPSMIAGNPVNTIKSGAFVNTGVKVLNLPDTIMTIEEGAIGYGIQIVYNSNTDDPIESGANSGSLSEGTKEENNSSEGISGADKNETSGMQNEEEKMQEITDPSSELGSGDEEVEVSLKEEDDESDENGQFSDSQGILNEEINDSSVQFDFFKIIVCVIAAAIIVLCLILIKRMRKK